MFTYQGFNPIKIGKWQTFEALISIRSRLFVSLLTQEVMNSEFDGFYWTSSGKIWVQHSIGIHIPQSYSHFKCFKHLKTPEKYWEVTIVLFVHSHMQSVECNSFYTCNLSNESSPPMIWTVWRLQCKHTSWIHLFRDVPRVQISFDSKID